MPSERPSNTALNATPASTIRSGSMAPEMSRPRRATNSMVPPAPIKAAAVKARGEDSPNTLRASAAAKAAPAFMPNTPVSASGFRVMIWRMQPATASPVPARMAATVRGIRRSYRMSPAVLLPGPPRRPATISEGVKDCAPMNRLSTIRSTISKSASARKAPTRHLRRRVFGTPIGGSVDLVCVILFSINK